MQLYSPLWCDDLSDSTILFYASSAGGSGSFFSKSFFWGPYLGRERGGVLALIGPRVWLSDPWSDLRVPPNMCVIVEVRGLNAVMW